jgi:hypothetical protein
MNKLFLTVALCLGWAAGVSAQPVYVLQPQSGSIVATRTGSKLGLTYARQSLSVGTGTTNVTRLNQWSADTGSRSYRADYYPLALEGRVPMAGTVPWSLPRVDGMVLQTNGAGQARAESEYTIPGESTGTIQGGMNAGFVWVDHSNLTGPMIRLLGYGGELGHLRVEGNSNASWEALKADTANQKDVGVELQDTALLGYGVGKYHMDGFYPSFLDVGMAVTAISDAENGDESAIDVMRPSYCGIAFLSQHIQCLGFTFGYCAQQEGTPVMWKYEKGGDLHIKYLLAATPDVQKGIWITANDGNSMGMFRIGHVQIDATANDNYHVIHIEPTTGYSYVNTIIDNLHNEIGRTGALDTAQPLIFIKNNYGMHIIRSGDNLPMRAIHVEGGVVNLFPTVMVYCQKAQIGSTLNNIRLLFDKSSRGYVQVVFRDNTEFHAFSGSPANAGRFYTDFKGLINIDSDTTYQLVP